MKEIREEEEVTEVIETEMVIVSIEAVMGLEAEEAATPIEMIGEATEYFENNNRIRNKEKKKKLTTNSQATGEESALRPTRKMSHF